MRGEIVFCTVCNWRLPDLCLCNAQEVCKKCGQPRSDCRCAKDEGLPDSPIKPEGGHEGRTKASRINPYDAGPNGPMGRMLRERRGGR